MEMTAGRVVVSHSFKCVRRLYLVKTSEMGQNLQPLE